MRNLGTLILLSAAAFAQTPTTVQTPAVTPATVNVTPASHPRRWASLLRATQRPALKKIAERQSSARENGQASSTPKVKRGCDELGYGEARRGHGEI